MLYVIIYNVFKYVLVVYIVFRIVVLYRLWLWVESIWEECEFNPSLVSPFEHVDSRLPENVIVNLNHIDCTLHDR